MRYIQYQKRYWNPKANDGKGGSELASVNFFENELDNNFKQLAEAHGKLATDYKVKWLAQVRKAVDDAEAEDK
jgi:hypothetical protein